MQDTKYCMEERELIILIYMPMPPDWIKLKRFHTFAAFSKANNICNAESQANSHN